MKFINGFLFILILLGPVSSAQKVNSQGNDPYSLWKEGIGVIPFPKYLALTGDNFILDSVVNIKIDRGLSEEDRFAAAELSALLQEQWGVKSRITTEPGNHEIFLSRNKSLSDIGDQGYMINVAPERIKISAKSTTGLFYGIQTIIQLIQEKNGTLFIRGMKITDKPDIEIRAVHYDTKHFQEKKEYVKSFIRSLSNYKINMLIWEWEDKFAYKSHPEIGAPGAFTSEEMQELTLYAKKYHIQIVPLIQGLGHASYILKHPENKHLREIESNNWGFCPLREGTYKLMNDLIREAVEATPGSKYVHIGCDETYVLGKGVSCGCSNKAEKEGIYALRETYINKVSEEVKRLKRIPIAWDGGFDPSEKVKPVKGLFTPGGFNDRLDKASINNGYPLYIYDPNPGIEHLFLPYFYRENEKGQVRNHLEEAYDEITKAVKAGYFKGIISTSWNCSGVHNQIWMLRYLTAAEYSWNSESPGIDCFTDTFFRNYYGCQSRDVKELYKLLNKASYYYMSTFERKVWHWGEIGKTHLPDLPRDDMEFDPYWNTEYKDLVKRSTDILPEMARVKEICKINSDAGSRNQYDFELFERLADLFSHTARTCLMLSELERTIAAAADQHFDDSKSTYNELVKAAGIIKDNLAERELVYNEIKNTWEKSQMPKGMSTNEKQYLHARDQQRNFANRRPDLSFMICDEENLGLEEYLKKLEEYILFYKSEYL